MKEEAYDFVEVDTVKELIKKYSQFINFPIYLWESKTEEVEEPLDEDEAAEETAEDKVSLKRISNRFQKEFLFPSKPYRGLKKLKLMF